MISKRIDLNCDLGEGFDSDEKILPHITSANIACGSHAGDPATMRKTIRLAANHGVSIGAHPGLPDRVNFGRRVMQFTPPEIYDLVLSQVRALAAFASAASADVTHLKPHGALYHMAKDASIAQAIAEATRDFDPSCILIGLSGSELIKAGEKAGLRTGCEAFADRTYQADGTLTPRDSANALMLDPAAAAERVLRMIQLGTVTSLQGTEVPLHVDTICIHGDSLAAVDLAKAIRARLKREGIEVQRLAAKSDA